MIIPGNHSTPAGMSWLQAKHVFSLMTQHLPREYGLAWGVKQVWQDIAKIERTHIPFYLEHAIAYVGANASQQHANLTLGRNRSGYAHSVMTGYQLAMAVFCEMPGHLLSTLPELVDDLQFTIDKHGDMHSVARNILLSVKGNIKNGHYRDVQSLRSELLHYIDSIMNGRFSDETKTSAVQACCFILMHFH
jgi:hypothetical protein